MTEPDSPDILLDIRVHPDARHESWPKNEKSVHLSILDNTVAKYARTCATWFFDPPSSEAARAALSPDQLLKSFTHTIQFYPFWAGQISWSPYDPTNTKGYQHRHGRLQITYGGSDPTSYPGFGWTVVKHPQRLDELVPTAEARRASNNGIWEIDDSFDSNFLLPGEVVLEDTFSTEGLPGLRVQINQFECGGVGVTVKMTHCLADATSLMSFVRDWEGVNGAMVEGREMPDLKPAFAPHLLDEHARGDLNAKHPDEALIKQARSLPAHRYDWYASNTPECPPWFQPITIPPPDLDLLADHAHARGDPMPWPEWDMTIPVRHSIFYFSGGEIQKMWEAAGGQNGGGVSKMDALLAHVWAAILRAREIEVDEEVYLDSTVGMRTRLGLGDSFLGSPIRQIACKGRGTDTHAELANTVRQTIKAFDDKDALGAMLHDVAFDSNGQNIWATFLGRRHTLFTSWNRLGIYEVTFGSGQTPRYVDAYMPASDGLLQIMEAGPSGGEKAEVSSWYENGASVSLHLREDVMEKLSQDIELRKYA